MIGHGASEEMELAISVVDSTKPAEANVHLVSWTDFANSVQVHSARLVWRKGVRDANKEDDRRPR